MKNHTRVACFSKTALVISLIGCTPAPRSQWVWDVEKNLEYRPSPALREKLETKIDMAYEGEQLHQVFGSLQTNSGANINVNWPALEAASIDQSTEVTMRLRGVSLATALKCLLEDLGAGETDLRYEFHDDVIMVSTAEDLARRTITRIYDVSLLIDTNWTTMREDNQIRYRPGLGGSVSCFGGERSPTTHPSSSKVEEHLGGESLKGAEAVRDIIIDFVDPESWRTYGGNVGEIRCYGPLLIIQQTPSAHVEIERLLEAFRFTVIPR